MTGATGRPWLRRNWWGLAAVAPLLAAAVYLSPDRSFDILRDELTARAVPVDADGWVSYGEVRMRVAEFGPAELFDDDQRPFEVPGLAAWQVRLTIEPGEERDALYGCEVVLEDAAGRQYLDGPEAIGSAHDATGDGVDGATCAPPYDEQEGSTGPFETVGYFMLPESIPPVAVRVTHNLEEPAYVRLEVG